MFSVLDRLLGYVLPLSFVVTEEGRTTLQRSRYSIADDVRASPKRFTPAIADLLTYMPQTPKSVDKRQVLRLVNLTKFSNMKCKM